MESSWVRRRFDAVGLTQSPPGPHLAALQEKHGVDGGTVLLCIDVSGSMAGKRLRLAIAGGEQFLREAIAAQYSSGLVLWNTGVHKYVRPDPAGARALSTLGRAHSWGGTDLVPCLKLAKKVLGPLDGDRVLCIFSDGGFGHRGRCRQLARELCAMGVRIVVRGLGAGRALADLACPGCPDNQQVITNADAIGMGIASMAANLTRGMTTRRSPGGPPGER